MIKAHSFAKDGRFADHNSGAMVDEEASFDLGTWIDSDPRRGVRKFGDDARDEGCAERMQGMSEAMVDDCCDPWIAGRDLIHASRRWPVSIE